jgi:hypothetical protein
MCPGYRVAKSRERADRGLWHPWLRVGALLRDTGGTRGADAVAGGAAGGVGSTYARGLERPNDPGALLQAAPSS